MKKFFYLTLIFLSALNYHFAYAQSKNIAITGRVISFEESLGLEGVSINIKGSSYYSGTHADGTFSLSVDTLEKILVFSLQDYQTTELKLNENSHDYEVVLKRSNGDESVIEIMIKTGGKNFYTLTKKKRSIVT